MKPLKNGGTGRSTTWPQPSTPMRILGGEERVKEFQARGKEQERKAADCDTELAKVEKTIAGLTRQEEKIREKMLVHRCL